MHNEGLKSHKVFQCSPKKSSRSYYRENIFQQEVIDLKLIATQDSNSGIEFLFSRQKMRYWRICYESRRDYKLKLRIVLNKFVHYFNRVNLHHFITYSKAVRVSFIILLSSSGFNST